MSWDVMLSSSDGLEPGQPQPPKEWDPPALGSRISVQESIGRSLQPVDWSDPHWGVYQGEGFTIEFNLGSDESIDSVMLHVRGEGDPLPAIVSLCVTNGWAALDFSTGELLNLQDPSPDGWNQFRAFRDEASAGTLGELMPGRLPKSDLVVSGASLVFRSGKHGERSHELGSVDSLEVRKAVSWGTLATCLVLFGLGAWCWAGVDSAWVRWPVTTILVFAGLLLTTAIRTPRLFLSSQDSSVGYWLFGHNVEVEAFMAYLSKAHQAALEGTSVSGTDA